MGGYGGYGGPDRSGNDRDDRGGSDFDYESAALGLGPQSSGLGVAGSGGGYNLGVIASMPAPAPQPTFKDYLKAAWRGAMIGGVSPIPGGMILGALGGLGYTYMNANPGFNFTPGTNMGGGNQGWGNQDPTNMGGGNGDGGGMMFQPPQQPQQPQQPAAPTTDFAAMTPYMPDYLSYYYY